MLISFFLMVVLSIFTYIKRLGAQVILSFPPGTNCASIDQVYKNETEYLHYAKHDLEPTMTNQGIGTYQCYCEK